MPPYDLTGLIDMHLHTAPDARPRYADDLDTAQMAAEAGMRAILIKSHDTLTADRAAIAQKAVGGALRVLGGLALNRAVGGLNPAAVEYALRLGARQIWAPTFDLARPDGYRFPGPTLTDAEGRIRAELIEILDLLAQADVALGTGHLPVAETLALIPLARSRGVRRIVVTHPDALFIAMPLAAQMQVRGEGVYFERCYNDVTSISGPSTPLETIAAHIRATDVERNILSTDYGQANHPAPVEGLREYLSRLAALGFSDSDLRRMAGENPAAALGI